MEQSRIGSQNNVMRIVLTFTVILAFGLFPVCTATMDVEIDSEFEFTKYNP